MIQDIDDTFVVKCNCSKQTIIIEFAKKKKNLKSRTDRILKDESKMFLSLKNRRLRYLASLNRIHAEFNHDSSIN